MQQHYLVWRAKDLFAELATMEPQQRIDVINAIRLELHKLSPMKDEPVDCVLWLPAESVQSNDYNPNSVAPPEMKLLNRSVEADGFTQPIVAMQDGETALVVDGFHRNRVGRENNTIRDRVHGRLPVAYINQQRTGKDDRMASTIRHNRARGKHSVDGMSDIVLELTRRNWSDAKVAKELGMEPDEVLRLKQVSGLAEMFATREFSEAWEV